MTQRTVLAISGNVRSPSRTHALVAALADAVSARLGSPARVIEVAKEGLPLLAAPTRAQLSRAGEKLVAEVESADLLIVGTPVYRASYTGALKHLFDLVHYEALAGTPVLLAATGGTRMHGLVTEHQLRPLMGFFGALTVPTTVYAVEEDFAGYVVSSPAVLERIERAADDAAALLEVARGRRARAGAVPAAAVA